MKNSSLLACLLLLFLTANLSSQEIEVKKADLAQEFAKTINAPDIGDAYPYLSADGLRLYFTSDRDGSFGGIFFCSRNSVDENFNKPVAIGKNILDGFYCSTLTADELTMYVAKEGEVYVSKRKSMKDEFTKPEMIKGLVDGFKFAPAISPDGNELIVVKELEVNKYETFVYRKTSDLNFKQTGKLTHPNGILGGGQFSKDGLAFYVSYEPNGSNKFVGNDSDEGIEFINIKYTRETLNEDFKTIEELPAAANPTKRNHQPTVNGDGNIMIIVNTEKYDWRYNELRLINLEKEIVIADTLLIACDDGVLNVEKYIVPDTSVINYLDTLIFLQPYKCNFGFLDMQLEALTDTIFCTFGGNDHFVIGGTIEQGKPEVIPQVKIYPNPFINNLVVTLDKNNLNSNFELYDISGRKILTTKLSNSINNIQFNKPGAGAYFYNIRSLNGKVISTGKLIKR